MKYYITVHLFIALLLTLAPVQVLQIPADGQSDVTPLVQVLAGCLCQPMKQLVDVEQEFPDKVQWMYLPTCVSLWRCSGWCADENLECHPLRERNVTLEMMKIVPRKSQRVQLTFVEHQQCECRVRQMLQHQNSSSSGEATEIRSQTRPRKHKKAGIGCGKCQFPQGKNGLY